MSKKKRWTYEEVKEIIESKGYKLISEQIKNVDDKLILQDSIGYLYTISFYCFYKDERIPNMTHPSNPYSIQNIKLFLKLNYKNLYLITNCYSKNTQKLTLIDKEGFLYLTTIKNLKNGYTPYIVHKLNPYSIQNIKLWLILNNKPFELLSDTYEGNNKDFLKWKCLKDGCNETFEAVWNSIINDRGCPFCKGMQVGLSNCLATKRPDLIKEWHSTKNGDFTPYDVTYASGKYAWWKCIKCGHEWEAKILNRYAQNSGCPKCNESHGEKKLSEIFNFYHIINEPYYSFPDCKYKNILKFDFYLPSYNTCVEYQGIQHYKPVDFAGKGEEWAKENFKTIQIRDQIKRDYCKMNNIKLLEIPYWEFDNIEEIIKKELVLL